MKKQEKNIVAPFPDELQLLVLLSRHKIGVEEDKKIKELEHTVDWPLLLDLAKKHRLTSHLVKNIGFLSDNVDSNVKEQIVMVQKGLSKKALLFSQNIIQINQKLTQNNIPHLFFKGPLLSLELYNDIGQRDYKDIDLLVPVDHIEKARELIQELGFNMQAPKPGLSQKQKKINYTLSHHYHLSKPKSALEIELHWNMTNPKTFFPADTKRLILNAVHIKFSNHSIPYISRIENLVFLAAHGSIHQWYRLFWLKDFSEIIRQSTPNQIYEAFKLSQKLKLETPFWQACKLSNSIYNIAIPDYIQKIRKNKSFIQSCTKSIAHKDLRQQGILGKIKFVLYRLKLKSDFKYYFSLVYRLRTHFTDWEILPLPAKLFFMYYILRPFLLIYKLFKTK
ncbi:MAG: nucleotidyltransferase domain-containing protein [Bacteroidota bacterium]